jgi:type IV secretory pathway VirB2 component (pilin)
VNTTLQKWLMGLIGLGALYLVVTNPQGVFKAAQSIKTVVGGSETQIITGGRRG